VVSPFGTGVKAYWNGLSAAPARSVRSRSSRPKAFGAGSPPKCPTVWRLVAALAADRLALAAAREALEDAGLSRVERAEAALAVGAVGGGMLEAEGVVLGALPRASPAVRPTPVRCSRSRTPRPSATRLGLEGPRETLVMACSSGAASLALAADLIADGVVATALAGGVDALTRICFMGFNALKLLCPSRAALRSRPAGHVIGEAPRSWCWKSSAGARPGRQDLRTLAGHGMTTDAYHVTSPHPEGEGMVRAMAAALESGVDPGAPGARRPSSSSTTNAAPSPMDMPRRSAIEGRHGSDRGASAH